LTKFSEQLVKPSQLGGKVFIYVYEYFWQHNYIDLLKCYFI